MLLMPSRYHEFAPYSALEAMAAGVPVLASRLGGLPELIGRGALRPADDPAALAARMRKLWEEPERRRERGRRADRPRPRAPLRGALPRAALGLYAGATARGDRAAQPLDSLGQP